jgi:signal transduction histidine kinase
VVLQITDQGRGLPVQVVDPAPGSVPHVGLGIAGMRERVRQINGRFQIRSNSHGTTIEVALPVCADAQSKQSLTSAA